MAQPVLVPKGGPALEVFLELGENSVAIVAVDVFDPDVEIVGEFALRVPQQLFEAVRSGKPSLS